MKQKWFFLRTVILFVSSITFLTTQLTSIVHAQQQDGFFLIPSPSNIVHTGNPDNALVAIASGCPRVIEVNGKQAPVDTITFYILRTSGDGILSDVFNALPIFGVGSVGSAIDFATTASTIKATGSPITTKRDREGNAFLSIGSATNFPINQGEIRSASAQAGTYSVVAECNNQLSNPAYITFEDAEPGAIIEVAAERARRKRLELEKNPEKPGIVASDYLITEDRAASIMVIGCEQNLENVKDVTISWDQANNLTSSNRSRKVELSHNGKDKDGKPVGSEQAKVDIYFSRGINYIWYTCYDDTINFIHVPGFPVPFIDPFDPAGGNVPTITALSVVPFHFKTAPVPPPCAEGEAKDGTKTTNANDIVKCTKFATGIGNFDTDVKGLVEKIFSVLLSLSGGIAVLLVIRSGYQLMISQGNQEKVKVAKEGLTSALVGFLFLLFSLVILEIIGVDILQIPSLTR